MNATFNSPTGTLSADEVSEDLSSGAGLITRWLHSDTGSESRRDSVLKTLRLNCRKGSQTRLGEFDLRGISLDGEDLSDLDLSGYDLSDSDLRGSDVSGAVFTRCRLVGANLSSANLTGCEFLGADLTGADLDGCRADRAGFGVANLTRANFFNAKLAGATFTKANLEEADFGGANLTGSRMLEANLKGVNFTKANLTEVDFESSDLQGADFTNADLRGSRLHYVTHFDQANWIGVDINDVHFCGAYLVRRFIMDENYLQEFRNQGKFYEILYHVWRLTSDCGRSVVRWALVTLAIIALFAVGYGLVSVNYGEYPTFFSPVYFSIVTLTTLGYGDAVPVSVPAQLLAVAEALMGYVMLGGLLSIFANKMARRAD